MDVRDLNRDQLVELVREIMAANGTEEEDDRLVEILEASVPHPRVLNLIYHPDMEGFTDELTAGEVVDTALAHTPFRSVRARGRFGSPMARSGGLRLCLY
ncbi:bacteriocin immunity protein [Streptomyces sp. TE5632]